MALRLTPAWVKGHKFKKGKCPWGQRRPQWSMINISTSEWPTPFNVFLCVKQKQTSGIRQGDFYFMNLGFCVYSQWPVAFGVSLSHNLLPQSTDQDLHEKSWNLPLSAPHIPQITNTDRQKLCVVLVRNIVHWRLLINSHSSLMCWL